MDFRSGSRPSIHKITPIMDQTDGLTRDTHCEILKIWADSYMPASFYGSLDFKRKKRHSYKLSNLEDAQLRKIRCRANSSKWKSAQQSYSMVNAVFVRS